MYIGAELGGAAGARAPPLLHNPPHHLPIFKQNRSGNFPRSV